MRPRCVVLALVAVAAACAPPEDQETGSVDREELRQARATLSQEALDHLDAGNASYSDQDYEAARDHYEQVVEAAPGAAAGWFGLYMAYRALGDRAAADSALERAQSIAPGATLIHPDDRNARP